MFKIYKHKQTGKAIRAIQVTNDFTINKAFSELDLTGYKFNVGDYVIENPKMSPGRTISIMTAEEFEANYQEMDSKEASELLSGGCSPVLTHKVENSSQIAEIRYNTESKTLEVDFKTGKTYEYYEVPKDVFEDVRLAESAGKFFNSYIKSNFQYKQI